MRSLAIFTTLMVVFASSQAMDPKIFAAFIRQVDAGKQQVITNEDNLKADIQLHPDNRDQHKSLCGQLITMLDHVGINIDGFGKVYAGQMDSAQASVWAHAGSTIVFMMSDMKQFCLSI